MDIDLQQKEVHKIWDIKSFEKYIASSLLEAYNL